MRSRGVLAFSVVVAAVAAAAWYIPFGGRSGDEDFVATARRAAARAPEAGAAAEGASGTPREAAPASDATPQRAVETAASARRIFGRVVDARRHGVAGARIRFASEGRTPLEVASREGGAFEIALASVGSQYLKGWLLAVGPDGAIGDGRAVLYPDREDGRYDADHPSDFDAGALTILPPARLIVRVRDEHGPVAGADVTANVSSQWAFETGSLPVVASDADGVAVLLAPSCDATVTATVPGRATARTWTMCESGVEQTIELFLHSTFSVTLRVRDAKTNAPVANAHVVFSEMLSVRQSRVSSYNGPESMGSEGHLPDLVCDADGITHVDDVDPERHLSVRANAPGYDTPDRGRAPLDGSSREIELLLEPSGAKETRFPIVADEAPVPPDGAVVELHESERLFRGDQLVTAKVERRELVITGAPQGWHSVVAAAPDGSLAEFQFSSSQPERPTLRFKRPRKLELHVRHADGRSATDACVGIQGMNVLPPPKRSDEQGRVVFEGMLARRVDVVAYRVGPTGNPLATVDLREGDARVDVVMPERFEVTLAVTLDGRPGLPPTFRINSPLCFWKAEAEDPERGELRVSSLAGAQETKVEAWFVAEMFLFVKLDVPIVRGATPPVVPVALVRGAHLRLDVKRGVEQKFKLRIQKQGDDGKFTNLEAQYRAVDRVNGPNGLFDFAPLEAGTWRVQDEVTRIATEPVALATGEERTATLDISGAIVIHGRVSAPAGTDLRLARIVARGEPAEAGTDRWSRTISPGTYVLEDGTFERTIDGAQPFVRVWHPSLAPPPGDPYVEVRDPTQPVLLSLVDRPSLVFTLVRAGGATSVSDMNLSDRLAIALDREDGDPAHVTRSATTTGAASEVVQLAELPTGRWTLFLDPGGEAAPLLRTGVEISEAGTDLGTLTLERGSVLRVAIADGRANRSGPVRARARHVGAPDYSRFWSRAASSELVLPGLGAGRFEVALSDSTGKELWTGTAECDGAHETALTVELH
jgi:hypothetical protein